MPDTIDNTVVNMAINETRIKVEQYLCQELWDELCDQYVQNNLTDANAALLCLLKEIWVRLAYSELFFMKAIQLTQGGVVRKFSNDSENATEAAIAAVSKRWVGYAMNYVEKMRDYLKANVETNPLYANDCGDCDKPTRGGSRVGFYGIG
jgi:hypothetical protein